MKVTIIAQNICGQPTPFSFVCTLRNEAAKFLKGEGIVLRKETDEIYDPGMAMKIEFEWPFTKFNPGDVTWTPFPEYRGRWEMRELKFGDESFLDRPGEF